MLIRNQKFLRWVGFAIDEVQPCSIGLPVSQWVRALFGRLFKGPRWIENLKEEESGEYTYTVERYAADGVLKVVYCQGAPEFESAWRKARAGLSPREGGYYVVNGSWK